MLEQRPSFGMNSAAAYAAAWGTDLPPNPEQQHLLVASAFGAICTQQGWFFDTNQCITT